MSAGIASGTLFNYFPTKEAIVARLASDAIGEALAEAERGPGVAETLEEALFAVVAAGLRKLKPLRTYLPALLETSLSPLAVTSQDDAPSFRVGQLEVVAALAARHGHGPLPPTALQLYWTLYTGVLAFWANDKSPKQEDTLALVDDSLNMFVGWLRDSTRADSAGPASREP
jgi:AcrR family transcriptional regulator